LVFTITEQDGEEKHPNPANLSRLTRWFIGEAEQRTAENVSITTVQKTVTEPDESVNTTTISTGVEAVSAEPRFGVSALTNIHSWLGGTVNDDIKDFLARPVLVASGGSITGTSAFATILLPYDYMNVATCPAPNKMRGFLGFRATTVIRLMVNTTKFTQGRLFLSWIPNQEKRLAGPGATANYYYRSPMTITQTPHVELDVSCESQAILRVPYYQELPYLSIPRILPGAASPQFLGVAYCSVYSPLSVGASATTTTADYSVFVSFEDVELVIPTVTGVAQSQKGRRFGGRLKDEDKERSLPISRALMLTSEAAQVMTEVPLVSSFAAPAAWLLGALSKTAAAFGFSKPIVDAPVTRVARQELAYMNNCAGSEALVPMGQSAVNSVSSSANKLGSEVDEMALAYVAQIQTYVYRAVMTDAMVPGNIIMNQSIGGALSLGIMTGPTYNTTLATKDFTPLVMLWQLYKYYHGSIILTFKIVKTSFHSGRVVLNYIPGGTCLSLSYDNASVLKTIFDLQSGNEFEVVLPHMNLSYWLELGSKGNDLFGSFQLQVMNPLVAPDTCATGIEFLCEMRAGPDAEFAVPIESGLAPCIPNEVQGAAKTFYPFNVLVAQSSAMVPCKAVPEAGSFGGLTTKTDPSMQHCSEIIGEASTSLKQLCSIANRWGQLNQTSKFGVLGRVFDGIFASASGTPEGAKTALSLIAACYGYATGGYKYYFSFPAATSSTGIILSAGTAGSTPLTAITAVPADAPSNTNYVGWKYQYAMSNTSSNVVSFSTPAYNQLPMRIINAAHVSYDASNSPVVFTVQPQGAYTGYINSWRALGDDGRFSFWLCTPPVSGL